MSKKSFTNLSFALTITVSNNESSLLKFLRILITGNLTLSIFLRFRLFKALISTFFDLSFKLTDIDEITIIKDKETEGTENIVSEKDELYMKAVNIIKSEGKASTSFLQRKLQIGYNRAANIMETMEKEGIVGHANHVGKREIL